MSLPGSRLIRLIPVPPAAKTRADREIIAIYNLMAFRFPAEAAEKTVKELWMEIVEGRSELWKDIGEDKKECIRGAYIRSGPTRQHSAMQLSADLLLQRSWSISRPCACDALTSDSRSATSHWATAFSLVLWISSPVCPSAIFLFKSIAGGNVGLSAVGEGLLLTLPREEPKFCLPSTRTVST